MGFNVEKIYPQYHFMINGVSYAGNPIDNSMLFITKKVEYLVEQLIGHKECLVFLENGIEVKKDIMENNGIVFSQSPQWDYAKCASFLEDFIYKDETKRKFSLTQEGYYIGENVVIGDNSYIEPGVLIGHDVVIGKNAKILTGSKIKHTIIGNDFFCNENAVIGDCSFTMTKDKLGDQYRIPSLGRVIIGDFVEIGAGDVISRGMCGDTIIDNHVKMAELVHIGHETHIHKNVHIAAGTIVAGFVEIGENSDMGINSCVRNRIHLGKGSIIGMGSTVIRSVNDNVTVVGNPAKILY